MPWAKAYVDDVVNASSSLDEHLLHLRKLFTFFRKLGLSAKPSKVFLGYPSTVVLGQRVDSMGFSTTEEKVATVRKLEFPYTLDELEHFLGVLGDLRKFIPNYAYVS